jgi:hypothetical protein
LIKKPIEICCHSPEFRLVPSKFLTIVLGGTAASHTCSGVGGGHFLIKKSADRHKAALGDRTVMRLVVLAAERDHHIYVVALVVAILGAVVVLRPIEGSAALGAFFRL